MRYARELVALCTGAAPHEPCDLRTQSEAHAYAEWTEGNYLFELQRWADALHHYQQASALYAKLELLCADAQRPLYAQRCDDIAPNISYCTYNIRGSADLDLLVHLKLDSAGASAFSLLESKLDAALVRSAEHEALGIESVAWRGIIVPVRTAAVRVAIAKAREARRELDLITQESAASDREQAAFDLLLQHWSKAQTAVERELHAAQETVGAAGGAQAAARASGAAITAQPGTGPPRTSQKVEAQLEGLRALLAYATHAHLSAVAERDLRLADRLAAALQQQQQQPARETERPVHPNDLVRLFGSLAQVLTKLQAVADTPAMARYAAARGSLFESMRILYLAQVFANERKVWCCAAGSSSRLARSDALLLRRRHQWREATALYARALQCSVDAVQQLDQCHGDAATAAAAAADAARGRAAMLQVRAAAAGPRSTTPRHRRMEGAMC